MKDINLIRKIAWSFHTTTGLDLDDLIQEASLAYLDGLKRYDPDKGIISTYIWTHIRNQLTTYVKREMAYNHPLCDITELKINSLPKSENALFWENLTNEAREIADIVLQSPKPYVKSRVVANERIKHILQSRGWDMKKIKVGLSNLKLAYS
jgi:RNA polymerase sigma factor (sigma-70 family)